MKPADAEREIIELFGEVYNISKEVFDVEPINAPPKKQKEIRKWIVKNYPLYEYFPFINKSTEDEAVIDLIFQMNKSLNENNEEKQRFFNNFTKDFSDDVIAAFKSLVDFGAIYSEPKKDGNNVKIYVDNCATFNRILTLTDCDFSFDEEYDCIDFSGSTFTKNEDTYIIPALAENFEKETSIPVVFRFKDAEAETIPYNALEQTLPSFEPWSVLGYYAIEIMGKNDISSTLLNAKEKDLLPLLAEIRDIDFLYAVNTDEPTKRTFPILKDYFKKYDVKKLIPLLTQLEETFSTDKNYFRLTTKIQKELNKSLYEPLWREIFSLLVDSQSEYPKKSDLLIPKEKTEKLRAEIQLLMEQNGYSGIYPSFSKTTDLKSPRTADSHDEPTTVFLEKNAELFIHCIEEPTSDGSLCIQFLTGTALNKKGVNATDVFSCLFYNRGKLFNNAVSWDDFGNTPKTIEQVVNIAIKKTELKKLTKEERKISGTAGAGCFPIYISMGVMFGGLFTLLFSIFITLFVFVIDGSESAIDVLKSAPWGYCFLASGGLFGIAMYIVNLITKRK